MNVHEQILSASANANILSYFKVLHPFIDDQDAIEDANNYTSPYAGLGTRPDVVDRLWYDITADLPTDCRSIVYQTPMLVHPQSGIIFGYASGVPTYGIRLPSPEKDAALSQGAKVTWTFNDAWLKNLGPEYNTRLDLALFGSEWIFGTWQPEEVKWCLAAYHLAGKESIDLI